jgi:hypothetical protein
MNCCNFVKNFNYKTLKMTNRIIIALLVLSATIFACQNNASSTATTEESTTTEATTSVTGETFGEAVTADGAVGYSDMLTKLQGADSIAVKVRAKVTAVCQAKGCWMNVLNEEGQPEMFVKFKDYGFFVPKDIAGREVIMEGFAYREETSVDELRHYAEDEGKSQDEIEAITAPVEELKFMASGVLLIEEKTD